MNASPWQPRTIPIPMHLLHLRQNIFSLTVWMKFRVCVVHVLGNQWVMNSVCLTAVWPPNFIHILYMEAVSIWSPRESDSKTFHPGNGMKPLSQAQQMHWSLIFPCLLFPNSRAARLSLSFSSYSVIHVFVVDVSCGFLWDYACWLGPKQNTRNIYHKQMNNRVVPGRQIIN